MLVLDFKKLLKGLDQKKILLLRSAVSQMEFLPVTIAQNNNKL